MATEPASSAKTPEEIYLLASRSEQVIEAAKLLEYALREYSGDYRQGFTELYNGNRKVFDKSIRDRLRSAFDVRGKIRNVAKYGEPEFEAKTEAAESFVTAAEFLFVTYQKIYPPKFWPKAEPADASFFEQGFEPNTPPENGTSSFQQVRARVDQHERDTAIAADSSQAPASVDQSTTPTEPADAIANLDDEEFELPSYQLNGPGGLFPPRFKLSQLEKITNRLGRSLKAGISITVAWQSETENLSGTFRESFREVFQEISQGETLANAVAKHDCFPRMFCEMVRVGEETGRLDQVFLRLSDHYRNLIQMRRTFISGVTWPIFQFCGAVAIVSLFFIVLSVLETALANFRAPDIFMLGFSPIGNLFLFWTLVGSFVGFGFLAIKGTLNGWFGSWPMALALRIPLLGKTIQILSLSRFAWSFGMAIETGMDAQRAVQLGIRSTNNAYYMDHEQEIVDRVGQGSDFYSALKRTEAFPEEFLQALEVGELTGEITESLERLSDDYREQAEILLRRISQICGFFVSIFVAGIVILLIVLMYMNYIGTLNDAISNPMGALERYEKGETTDNPVTAVQDQMVKQIMENKDMKNITNIYKVLGRSDEMSNDDFLDALLDSYDSGK